MIPGTVASEMLGSSSSDPHAALENIHKAVQAGTTLSAFLCPRIKRFVQFATQLADRGKGTYYHWEVQPNPQLATVTPPDSLSRVDLVLLASRRYTDSYFYRILGSIGSLSEAAMLCSWLTTAGFRMIYDYTFGIDLSVVANLYSTRR